MGVPCLCWVRWLLGSDLYFSRIMSSGLRQRGGVTEAVRTVAREYLDGRELTEGLLNHNEVVIRAYAPCLSRATDALRPKRLDVAPGAPA